MIILSPGKAVRPKCPHARIFNIIQIATQPNPLLKFCLPLVNWRARSWDDALGTLVGSKLHINDSRLDDPLIFGRRQLGSHRAVLLGIPATAWVALRLGVCHSVRVA